jgi:serine/threonine-protein kinase RsbW
MVSRTQANITAGISLRIKSDPAELAPTRVAIEKLCTECSFGSRDCEEIGLVVNEALANVIRHAYDGQNDRPIEVTASVERDVAKVEIRDWGKGVNPDDLPPSPAASNPLVPGGLGLVCMRRMMDSVVFIPQPDGMLLRMTRTKRATDRPAEASAHEPKQHQQPANRK